MSTTADPTTGTPATPGGHVPPSTANKLGYVLATLLGLNGLSAVLFPPAEPGVTGPPMQVLAVASGLGAVTLLGVWLGWARRSRAGARTVAASRVLSLLLAMPAFFVDGVPAAVVAEVGLITVATITCVVLVLLRPRAAAA
jgi:hypothetical protein